MPGSTVQSFQPNINAPPSLNTPSASGSNFATPSTPPAQPFQPGPAAGSNGAGPNTFKNDSSPESRLRPNPIPYSNGNGPASPSDKTDGGVPSTDSGVEGRKTNLQQPPRMLDPADRMTSLPVRQAMLYRPVTVSVDQATHAILQQPVSTDESAWRDGSAH